METNILSMLEFSCLIQENEQTVFESLLKNDFEEAYMNLNEAGDDGKSFLDKAKETAKAVWEKILQLLQAFKRKLFEWVQLVRKKFGDLIKADQKIAKELDKVKPEMLEGWKVPKEIHTDLAFFIFCTKLENNPMNAYFKLLFQEAEEAKEIIDEFVDKVTELKPGNYYSDLRNKDTIAEMRDKYLDKLKEAMEDFDGLQDVIDQVINKDEKQCKASNDTIAKDLNTVQNILRNKYDLTDKLIKFFKTNSKVNNSLISCFSLAKNNNEANDNEDEASSRLLAAEARAIKALVDFYVDKSTQMYHRLLTLNAKAYADIRKYALGAIHYAAKHSEEFNSNIDSNTTALVPIAASFIYDASDEYVYESLGLAV